MKINTILIILFLLLGLSSNLQSQIRSKEPVDFTLTSVDGIEVNLFNKLDENKTVLLNFFSTTCLNCALDAPIVDSVYEQFGSGTEELLVWGIARAADEVEDIQDFIAETEITYPCFPTANADDVFSFYEILYTPQIIIICDYMVSGAIPHNQIVESLNYCFPTKISTINVYPDIYAMNQEIIVKNTFNDRSTVLIYDITGRQITKSNIAPNEQHIFKNLKNNNLYIVKILTQSGETLTKKILLR